MNRSAEDGEWSSPHSGGEGTGVPPRRTKVCGGDTVGKSVSDPGRPGIVHREGMAGIVRHSQKKGRETGNAKPGLEPPMVGADISASEGPTEAMPGVGSGRGTQERGQSKRPRIAGKQWQGRSWVKGKHVNPAWSPPAEVRADNPRLPAVIPGGSPHNPMGPRALTLLWGEYAIHGTNRPSSIGTFASYGCIRMYNQDILDLFERVSVGTPVVVTPGTAEAPSRPHGAAIPAVTLTDMSKSHSDRRARPNADGPHSRSVQQAIQETAIE